MEEKRSVDLLPVSHIVFFSIECTKVDVIFVPLSQTSRDLTSLEPSISFKIF